jgi:hypothetical protein
MERKPFFADRRIVGAISAAILLTAGGSALVVRICDARPVGASEGGAPLSAPVPPRSGTTTPLAELGKPAPDFELPLLHEEVHEDGRKVLRAGPERIRLSSFRGKKAVCVFLSSYT